MRKIRSKTFSAAALLLSAVLLLGLCGCGAPDIGVLDGPGMEKPLPTETPEPAETEPPAPAPADDPDEAAAQYLTGDWVYCAKDGFDDILWLTLKPDGSYTMEFDAMRYFWGYNDDDSRCCYAGSWSAETADGGYILSLSVESTDDPNYEEAAALGSCFCEELSWCDGKLLLQITSAEEPFGFFPDYFDVDRNLFVLTRDEVREPTAERRCGESFYAQLWKSRYGCNGEEGDFGFGQFVIFADDIKLGENYEITNEVRECVSYIVSDTEGNDENLCMLSGGLDGLLPYGDAVYRLETNDAGEIIDAVYVSTLPPLSPEEAEEVLCGVGEMVIPLEEGAEIEYLGVEDVWSEHTCLFIVHCSGGDIRYAVCPDGEVFRYRESESCWEWIDPIAVG